ncbi:hypothetical protein [Actinoplanes utahensis]|uniref:DUF8094 domain-containing protein n=1 Tax=Actinoplanes utahensis TaxID=1869 RepID=A0A0A6UKX0_ACTUT|nr:hypothetical protein [Actinoplanes utahensis]KHD75728.1 hypothetical protein MB27_21145 [Actinoplanes utahensis]GIF34525.1 hypothetical protein Aut01nite_75110 [Actinoplanes utahensis]
MPRHTSRILAGALMALATAACVPDRKTEDPAPAPTVTETGPGAVTGSPLVSEADVDNLIRDFTAWNNRTNLAVNAGAVTEFESEAAREMDEAALSSRAAGDVPKPFSYQRVGSRVPGRTSGADWFVVETMTSLSSTNFPLIMVRDGSRWKLAHYAEVNAALPQTRTDLTGNVEIVDAADAGGTLVAAPEKVAAAHAKTIAFEAPADPLFGGDTTTKQVLNPISYLYTTLFQSTKQPVAATRLTYRTEVAPYPVRALRTAEGGAVIAYTTVTEIVGTYPGLMPYVKPQYRKISKGAVRGRNTIHVIAQWWAQVPPKGSNFPVAILGGTTGITRFS